MRENGFFPIDYRTWAGYWDLLEHHGLNAENARFLAELVQGPVLLLGSGQGLLSRFFSGLGHEVCSVDSSPEMAARARHRRGVETVVCDAADLRVAERFNTVVVSTGVINERTLGRDIVSQLLTTIDACLAPGGRLVVGYFRMTPWTRVATDLGLYGRPSANAIFWKAQGDLGGAEHLFASGSARPSQVHAAFSEHPDRLLARMHTVLALGQRYVSLHHQSPTSFLEHESGYYPYPLSTDSEAALLARLGRERVVTVSQTMLNGDDTRVLVCERGVDGAAPE